MQTFVVRRNIVQVKLLTENCHEKSLVIANIEVTSKHSLNYKKPNLTCGHAVCMCCPCACMLMHAGFAASSWGWSISHKWWWVCLLVNLTFDLYHTPSIGPSQASSGHRWEAVSVINDCVEVVLRRKWVVWLWWNGICAFWCCWSHCVVLVVLFLDFQQASGDQSKFHGEWASLRNRMVLLWVCPGTILPSSPLSTFNAHFWL